MFRNRTVRYLYKFHLISDKKFNDYMMKTTMDIIRQHKEVFIRLKNS